MHYSWDSECRDSSEAFRLLLHTLSQALEHNRLDEIKFQCSDHIGRGKLEQIETALELFRVLEERDVISVDDVDFLILCLNNIYRKDLAKLVKEYVRRWITRQSHASKGSPRTFHDSQPPSKAYSGFDANSLSMTYGDSSIDAKTEARPFGTTGYIVTQELPPLTYNQRIPQVIEYMIGFLSNNLSTNWRATVRHLGVPDAVISAAGQNWPSDVKRQIVETLNYWARTSDQVSQDVLIEATRATGRNDLADNLQDFYGDN